MADLSVKPLIHVSLYSFRRVSSRCVVSLMYTFLQVVAWHFEDVCLLFRREGAFDFRKERTEGGSGLEHSSDVEVPTHPSDPLANAIYVDSGWHLLLPFLLQRQRSKGNHSPQKLS